LKRRKPVVRISLNRNIIQSVDRIRGPIPRSSFIEWLIEEALFPEGSERLRPWRRFRAERKKRPSISITLEPVILEVIDEARGERTRSEVIEMLINRALERHRPKQHKKA
jgi:metal-responsive CopG/Arc/MetJ family transcriptional regulator